MNPYLRLGSDGCPTLGVDDHVLISGIEIGTHLNGHDVRGAARSSPWEASEGSNTGEAPCAFHSSLHQDQRTIGHAELRQQDHIARLTVTLAEPLTGLFRADSFETSNVFLPRFRFAEDLRFFLVTFGLGAADADSIGGYWPTALTGRGPGGLPKQGFAPLVIYDRHAAVAMAPATHFLTSPLIAQPDGAARILHGAVQEIPALSTIQTLFAAGDNPSQALMQLGDALLAAGSKARPNPADSLLTSTLGWWNAYGGYYTEPIHPLDHRSLDEVQESLAQQDVPVSYLGIDLWYPYRQIGQAIKFAPDREKYPDGVGSVARKHVGPTVLHLSALDKDNAYRVEGADPSFYERVAETLEQEGAMAAWHDWLRTQQHQTEALRADPDAAEAWFAGMASAFAQHHLQVLLCMHTMGMALASTRWPNVVSARSHIDYLFALPEALDTLASLGHAGFWNEATPPHRMRRQNLLVGFTLYALGLLPFHDLFLTQHHEGLGATSPDEEAILRALSCGPVGIGDGPGLTDTGLIDRLLSRQRLPQPDHPLMPQTRTLGEPVEIFETEHVAGVIRWLYLVALNTTPEPQVFDIPLQIQSHAVLWDGLRCDIVPTMRGTLAPGALAYYIVIPRHAGIAPLGLWNKLVPAPARVITHAQWDGRWRLDIKAPGETFALWSPEPIDVTDERDERLPLQRAGDFWLCELREETRSLHAIRR